MLLVPEQCSSVGELRDATEVHDRDPVADVLDHAHVVGHEEIGQPKLALQLLEQVQDLGLDRHVERGDGLVADDQVGFEDERPGDPDPLALPAGKLVRVAARVIRREPDEVHHPADLVPSFVRAPESVDPEPLADAVGDRRPRVEARVRVLEDDLDPPAIRLEGRTLEGRQLDAIETDRARSRLDEAKDQATDCGLAAAGLADEAERLAAPDVEVDAIDGLDRPDLPLEDPAADRKVLDEVPDLDERLASARGRGPAAGRRAASRRPRLRPASPVGVGAALNCPSRAAP